MTLTEIGRPQVSGGCPYKVLNSQWVPTRPEAMWKWTNECVNITQRWPKFPLKSMVISNFPKFGMVKLFKNLHNVVDVDTLLTQI